jgi:hypothetical protein
MRSTQVLSSVSHPRSVLVSQIQSRLLMTLLIVMILGCGTAMAAPPIMTIDDASAFEGNSGTTILQIPVRFTGAQPTTVSGLFSATPLSGTGFNTPVGGVTCSTNVDFIPQTNVPFSIPANTVNGTFFFSIVLCGDSTIEPNEQIFVSLSNVAGADCSLEGTCNGIGTIVNDDGPPAMNINSISASTFSNISKVVNFTVSLNHPSVSAISMHFATRDGSAKALTTTTISPAYVGTSGTLNIPPNTLTAQIPVTILGKGAGTFFMDLSSPVNATLGSATGQGTIQVKELIIGTFEVSPDDAQVNVGDRQNFVVRWSVPDGSNWHDLSTIDFRLGKGNQIAIWLRWDEFANTFSLCEGRRNGNGSIDDGVPPECGAGVSPGSGEVLETSLARLYLAGTSVLGSGPTGPDVTLTLLLSFKDKAAGHLYEVELAVTDDLGHHDAFFDATTVHAKK